MTKWPAAFRCKSRLSNDIGAEQASRIQRELIAHTTSVAKKLKEKCCLDIVLAVEGIGIKKARQWGGVLGIKNISLQGHGTLGERMKRQLLKIKNEKNNFKNTDYNIIVIGTDLPSLSVIELENAFQELKKHSLVIGPAEDGGYWLIGFSKELLKPVTSIPFRGINWGSNSVLKQTLCQINKHKVSYKLLTSHNDVDNVLDLKPWLTLSSKKIKS